MKAIIAAATLALVTSIVTIGSIWTAGEAHAYCPIDEPCPEAQRPRVEISRLTEWEGTAHRVLFQVEQGFLQMAGMPTYR